MSETKVSSREEIKGFNENLDALDEDYLEDDDLDEKDEDEDEDEDEEEEEEEEKSEEDY